MLYDLKTETDNLLMHVIALRKVHIPENFFLEVLIKLINAFFADKFMPCASKKFIYGRV